MLISTPAKFAPGDFVLSRTGEYDVLLVRAVTFIMGGSIEYRCTFGLNEVVLLEGELVPMLDEDTRKPMNIEMAGENGTVKVVPDDDEGEDEESEQ